MDKSLVIHSTWASLRTGRRFVVHTEHEVHGCINRNYMFFPFRYNVLFLELDYLNMYI